MSESSEVQGQMNIFEIDEPSEVICRLSEISKESLDWQEEAGKAVGKGTNIFVEQALEYMRNHYYERLTLPQVAKKVGISEGYLSSLFTRHCKRSFRGLL